MNDTSLWHPFAAMGDVRHAELVFERGEDVWVWDTAGRRYLDATASLWNVNVGHGRPEIAAAVAAQLARLEAYSNFGDLTTVPSRELAALLAERSPMPDTRIFLGSGGGDAIETATKMARRYWHLEGAPDRVHVIGRERGYHGTHGFGTALGGIGPNRDGMGPMPEDFSSVPHDSLEALEAEISRLGAARVAAVFLEPVIGAGGVHPPGPGYVEGVAELCRATGVLFVVDAVICGFGRLGTWYGIERWDVVPDMICFAKGVTSGYLPLGGVAVSGRVAAPFWADGSPPFRHGATYAGHAACCAAAIANLRILEDEGLLARGRTLEGDLLGAMAGLADHPLVAEVRGGTGLMAAVAVDPEALAADPGLTAALAAEMRDRGVLTRNLGDALAVSPPLTVAAEHLEMISAAFEDGLGALADRTTAGASSA